MTRELEYTQNRHIRFSNSKILIIRSQYTIYTALLKRKDYKNEFFILYKAENGIKDNLLTHLFMAHDKHIDLLIENFEILIIDSTYKTNIFQIPLINIIGMTAQNRSFFTKNIFIPDEKEKNYKLIFYTIRKIYDNYGILYPSTFITDTCPAEIAAIKYIFPNINHILCIWHINYNILTKLKPLIKAQFDRENGNNVKNIINTQIFSQTRNKTKKLTKYLNVK